MRNVNEAASFTESGESLQGYQKDIERERRSRTLTLRRSNHPNLACKPSKPKIPIFDEATISLVEPSTFYDTFNSANPSKIMTYLSALIDIQKSNPRLIAPLIQNPIVSHLTNQALASAKSEDLIISILTFISSIYQSAGQSQTSFIDDGLCMALIDMLRSRSSKLVSIAIAVTQIISSASTYARDSILCLGLHSELISIAKFSTDTSIVEAACSAIFCVFRGIEDMDSTIVDSCINPLSSLLSIHSQPALRSVLSALVSVTSIRPSLAFSLASSFPQIISLVGETELTDVALSLVGNMTAGVNVKALLDSGLLDVLFNLIGSQFTSQAFYVLSSLLENAPQAMAGVFTKECVATAVEIASSSSFEIKKEAAYFLASLILFLKEDEAEAILVDRAISEVAEMVDCGVDHIVVRCLDALLKVSQGFKADLSQSDEVREALERVSGSSNPLIEERVDMLSRIVDIHASEGISI